MTPVLTYRRGIYVKSDATDAPHLFCVGCASDYRRCIILSVVVTFQLGSSPSPTTMTGATCRRLGIKTPWRQVVLYYGTTSCEA